MGDAQLLILDAEVDGLRRDVTVSDGVVVAIDTAGSRPVRAAATVVLDARGGALVPGLHDHHLHLAATTAARESLAVGPDEVRDRDGFAAALGAQARSLPDGAWLRAVGYHESVAGDLDRDALDRLVPDRPVRVQHRSGAAWFVSSAGLAELGIADGHDGSGPNGAERDGSGRATGRLFRCDEWLRTRIPSGLPDLTTVGRELAAAGVVGVTDATPWPSTDDLARFTEAAAVLPQRLVSMTAPGVAGAGPVKVLLGDHELPALDDVVRWVEDAHAVGRAVAVHAVTAAALALALAAWAAAGVRDGDRLEHAAVVPDEAVATIAALGVRVVTQPGLVASRGDSYLDDIPACEHHELWRCGSLLAVGVRVAAGSDSPHGPLDPWAGIAAAQRRAAPSGRLVGPSERVGPATALGLYLSPLDHPGGPTRRVRAGEAADLCLLDAPLASVLAEPSADHVAATIIGGHLVHPPPGPAAGDLLP